MDPFIDRNVKEVHTHIVLGENCEVNRVQVFSTEKVSVLLGNINCGVEVYSQITYICFFQGNVVVFYYPV